MQIVHNCIKGFWMGNIWMGNIWMGDIIYSLPIPKMVKVLLPKQGSGADITYELYRSK